MYSLSKTTLPPSTIEDIVSTHFGAQSLQNFSELKDGYFNTAYQIELKDKQKFVLKVAPPNAVRVMRYEQNIMHAEVEAMRLVKTQTTVPVPNIYCYDNSRKLIDSDFFMMGFIAGTPFNKLRPDLAKEEQASVERQMGQYVRQMNNISGTRFGYYTQTDPYFDSWQTCFDSMIRNLLQDGQDMKVPLPISYDDLYSQLKPHFGTLDEILTPKMIHWDTWDGNIFVDPNTHHITGIIDFERALWGDPLMEAPFGFFEEPAAFMDGYDIEMLNTPTKMCRRTLYNIYVYLIMVIECYYRHYETQDQENWARDKLVEQLKKLNTYL